MQLRLVVICAVFVVLGALVFYLTQPAEPGVEPYAEAPSERAAQPVDGLTAEAPANSELAATHEVATDETTRDADGAHRLYGLVLDARSNEPIAGAAVFVTNPADGLPERVTTDAAGAYELRVRADQRAVRAQADGYAIARQTLPNPLQRDHRLDFSMRPGANIAGIVIEKGTNEPIADLEVYAAPAGTNIASYIQDRARDAGQVTRDNTDDEGRFLLAGLEPGSYRITLQARTKGFLFPSDLMQVVTLAEGDTLENVVFELERGAVVVGRVRDPDGRPVAETRVRAVPLDALSSIVRSFETQDTEAFTELVAESDEEGRFEVGGLSFDAEYRLFGSADGFAPSASGTFHIPSAQRRATVDLQMSKGSMVAGEVVLADGTPVTDQRLILMPGGDTILAIGLGPPLMERTGDTGDFNFAHVPPGSYTLSLTDRGAYRPLEQHVLDIDGVQAYGDLRIVVEPSQRRGFREGVITGMVLDTGGRPAPGVTVAARPAFIARGVASAETGPDGRFELSTPPGRRFDVIARTDFGLALLEGVEVGADVVLQLRPPARVSGIVIDAQNRPVPDCEVRLESTRVQEPQDRAEEIMVAVGGMIGPGDGVQQTEQSGFFLFADVEPGEYSVHAISRTLGSGESYKFTVSEGQDLSNVQIRLEPGIAFGGIVQDSSGQPVSGAFVRLIPMGPGGELQHMVSTFMPTGGGQQGESTASQRDGRFQMANVIPGEYTLEATHARYAKTVQRGITVSRGGNVANHLVTMTTGGVARGQYAPGGRPQAGAMILVLGESGMQMATTAFDGSFELGNMTSGSYMLFPMRFDAQDPADFLDLWNSAQVVDIEDGEISDISFEPPTGGQPVSGYVEADPGNITIVTLRRPGGPDPATINPLNMVEAMRALRYQVAVGVAGPDGSYSFDSIPPGSYIMDAVSLSADIMANPDPSVLMNLDQYPRVTQEVTVGSGPLTVNLQF